MPELTTQTQNSRPAGNVDLTKLKRLASGGLNVGQGDGLVDAFAEVFAAMSVAQPAATQPIEPVSQSDDVVDQDPVAETSESETESEDHQDSSSALVKADASNELTPIEAEAVAIVDVDSRKDAVDVESNTNNEAAVAIAVTVQADTTESTDTSTPEVADQTAQIQLTVAETETSKRDTKHQADEANPSALVAEPDEAVTVAQRDTATDDRQGTETNELGFTNQAETGSDDQGESSRRRSHRGTKDDHIQNIDASENATGDYGGNEKAATTPAAKPSVDAAVVPSDPTATTTGTSAATTNASASIASVRSATAATSAASEASKAASSNAIRPGGERPVDVSKLVDSAQKSSGNTESTKSATKSHSTADILLRAKLVQRVSKAFQHFGNEGGNIRLKLAPAELGSVRVEMNVREKKVQARVVAETDQAAQLLREQLPELRGRLEAQGMQIDQISVERDSGSSADSSSMFDRGGSPHNDGSNSSDSRQARTTRPGEPDVVASREKASTVSQSPLHVSAGVDLLY